ncbi:hypothetical protein HKX48_006741 [Thoreauomyces humboldtii]|nr:hypothetical protein HKX48_006741 [Thoreauomyces humboldtii]
MILGNNSRSTCVAYDSVQCILAVGKDNGTCLVVGKKWERLVAGGGSALRMLRFKEGDKYLFGVTVSNELLVWNLQSGVLQYPPVNMQAVVTSLEAKSRSKWVFIGFGHGEVRALDIASGTESTYTIPISPQVGGIYPVMAIHACPQDASLLLLGYTGGLLILWDLKESICRRSFALTDKQVALGSIEDCCWHPDGNWILGCSQQLLVIWTTKDGGLLSTLKRQSATKPTRQFSRQRAPRGTGRESTSSVHCFRNSSGQVHALVSANDGVEMFSMSNDLESADGVLLSCTDILEMITIADDAAVVLHVDGNVEGLTLGDLSSSLYISPSIDLSHRITDTFLAADCSEYFGWEMRTVSNSSAVPTLDLEGGTILNSNGKQMWDVLCTLSDNRTLVFWQLTAPPTVLFKLPLETNIEVQNVKLWMDLEQRRLMVAAGPSLVAYEWLSSKDAREIGAASGHLDNIDDMMRQMDEAVDAVLQQSNDIRGMLNSNEALNTTLDDSSSDAGDQSPTAEFVQQPPPLPPREAEAPPPYSELLPGSSDQSLTRASSSSSLPPPTPPRKDTPPLRSLTVPSTPEPPISNAARSPVPRNPGAPVTIRRRFTEIPEHGGWQPVFEAVHLEPITLMTQAPEILVTATGAILHITIHRSTVLSADVRTECQDVDPTEAISLFAVVHTYFNGGSVPVPCVMVGTTKGRCLLYTVKEDQGRPILRSCTFANSEKSAQRVLHVSILDSDGRQVKQLRSGASPGDHFVILAFDGSVNVILLGSGEKPTVIERYVSAAPILKAGLAFVKGDPVLVAVAGGGVQVLELPNCQVAWAARLPVGHVDESRLRKTHIAKDGRLLIQTSDREFEMFSISSDTSSLPDVQPRMYELVRSRVNNVQARSYELGPSKSSASRSLPGDIPSSSSSGSGPMQQQSTSQFGRNKEALNERGEKLSQLESKFGDLADSSKGFLSAIQEYNDKQVGLD